MMFFSGSFDRNYRKLLNLRSLHPSLHLGKRTISNFVTKVVLIDRKLLTFYRLPLKSNVAYYSVERVLIQSLCCFNAALKLGCIPQNHEKIGYPT